MQEMSWKIETEKLYSFFHIERIATDFVTVLYEKYELQSVP